MSTQSVSSLLVIRSGAIGDTIVMSVVYQALRRRYPHAYLEAMGSVERLQLINSPGLINKLTSIEMPGFSMLFTENADCPPPLTRYFQQFDTVLAYHSDPDGILTENLRKFGIKRVHRFDPFPPEQANIHITTYLLNTLNVLGIAANDLVPEITFPEYESLIPDSGKMRIAIHLGSGSSKKNWAVSNFVELAARLSANYQAEIFMLAGTADEQVLERFRNGRVTLPVTVLLNQPLPIVASELRRCALYIGNDSGMSHLAAAIGIPTLALFGASNPDVWRPIGKRVAIIRGNGKPYCEGVSVEQVFARAIEMLAKNETSPLSC